MGNEEGKQPKLSTFDEKRHKNSHICAYSGDSRSPIPMISVHSVLLITLEVNVIDAIGV